MATKGRLTAANKQKIQEAIDNHESMRHSYMWNRDNGNRGLRNREERKKNFEIRFGYGGDLYRYISQVHIRRTNFYYSGSFYINDEKRDVRLFKNILKAKGKGESPWD